MLFVNMVFVSQHGVKTFIIYHVQRKYEPPRDKTNNVAVRPAKTQISLGIRPVWSESLLCAQWVAKGPSFLHADSEDSNQTGRMPRLIWVFTGRTLTWLVFSRGGSFIFIEILFPTREARKELDILQQKILVYSLNILQNVCLTALLS